MRMEDEDEGVDEERRKWVDLRGRRVGEEAEDAARSNAKEGHHDRGESS